MPDVSKLNLDGTSYDIKDDAARKYLVVVNNTSQPATKVNITTSENTIDIVTQDDLDKVRYTVADYGIFPYPTMTDCSDALQDLLDQGIDLVFPPGNYRLFKKLTITGGASIRGSGSSRTVLEWRPGSESVGIECTLGLNHSGTPKQKQTLYISDITLANNTTIDGTAVYVDGRATTDDRLNIGPQFRGVNIVGYNANGWNVGIDLNTCNGTSVIECSISGDINGSSTAGIRIDSDPEYNIGTEHMITNTKIGYFIHDIEADRAEGIVVSNSVLLATNYGIHWVSTTGTHPHLSVVNTHINATKGNIKTEHIAQATISNNLFYLGASQQADDNNPIDITGSGTSMCTIHGNSIYGWTGTYNCAGIKYGGAYGTIYGNSITLGSGATGIVLTNESSHTTVYGNILTGVGTKYSNSGSQNTSDLDGNRTTLVSGPASGINLVGSNYIVYSVEGVHMHLSFSTTAEVAAETVILQHYVPANLVPMGNYVAFERTDFRTVVFELLSTGAIKIKTTVPAGKKFEFDIHARYAI